MRTLLKILTAPLLVTAGAGWAGHLRGIPGTDLARVLPAVLALLTGMWALGLRMEVSDKMSRWLRGSPARTFGLAQTIWVPYLLYALPLGIFSAGGFLRLFLYVNLPLLVMFTSESGSPPRWRDVLAVALVWLPLEFRLLGPLWSWPPGQAGNSLNGLVGTCLAVFLFVVVRDLPGVGYTFEICWRDLLVAGLIFLSFTPMAVALGLSLGFLRPAGRLPALGPAFGTALGILVVTGLPEELLFRGLIQNLIRHKVPRPALSIALAALVFGTAHLNVGSHPDWRLWLLATLAGLAYGLAYHWSGTLMAPALVHTLVNSTWAFFFRR